jgi:hypothetical protein
MMLGTSIAALAATASRNRNKNSVLFLIAALGLAVFPSFALAQQQPGVDIGTQGRFQIWRTTTLGSHKGVDSYRDALDAAKMKIGDAADEILGRPAFYYVRQKTEVELTLVSVAELGVEKESPLSEVYQQATQFGLTLCPAEVGPQLRLDYRDQPVGESLLIAMEPVKTYYGEPTILSLMNFGSGLALVGSDGRAESMVSGYLRFVFALPKRIVQMDERPVASTSPAK